MTTNQFNHYIETISSGKDMTQRHQVLHRIHAGCRTLVDIQASIYNIKMSSVSGRVSELLDAGMIEEDKPGNFKPVISSERAVMLSKARSDARYRKWLKQGEENGYFKLHAQDFFER